MAEAASNTTPENKAAQIVDDIIRDAEMARAKEKTLNKMRWDAQMRGTAQMLGMFSGPILGGGIYAMAGAAGVTPLGAAMVGVGTLLGLGAVATTYMASRTSQDGGFDQVEAGAQSTAKHIVEELKKNNLCLKEDHEYDNPGRADGKPWLQALVEQASKEQQAQMGARR